MSVENELRGMRQKVESADHTLKTHNDKVDGLQKQIDALKLEKVGAGVFLLFF